MDDVERVSRTVTAGDSDDGASKISAWLVVGLGICGIIMLSTLALVGGRLAKLTPGQRKRAKESGVHSTTVALVVRCVTLGLLVLEKSAVDNSNSISPLAKDAYGVAVWLRLGLTLIASGFKVTWLLRTLDGKGVTHQTLADRQWMLDVATVLALLKDSMVVTVVFLFFGDFASEGRRIAAAIVYSSVCIGYQAHQIFAAGGVVQRVAWLRDSKAKVDTDRPQSSNVMDLLKELMRNKYPSTEPVPTVLNQFKKHPLVIGSPQRRQDVYGLLIEFWQPNRYRQMLAAAEMIAQMLAYRCVSQNEFFSIVLPYCMTLYDTGDLSDGRAAKRTAGDDPPDASSAFSHFSNISQRKSLSRSMRPSPSSMPSSTGQTLRRTQSEPAAVRDAFVEVPTEVAGKVPNAAQARLMQLQSVSLDADNDSTEAASWGSFG